MIPVSKPCIDNLDSIAANRAIESGWISSLGAEIRGFEDEFASYIGVRNCIVCSNGTTALQLALVAIGIAQGDEVVVPNLTFAAVANAVLAVGGVPVCVDVERSSWNISTKTIGSQITDKTKAIIVVHSYGVPVDVLDIKKNYPNLLIIEDCAEAHGAEVHANKVGSIGDISTFSFFGNKIITTGEGGAVLTNNDRYAETIKILRDHGMDPKRKYNHIMPGFNYRMTNIQGAIGRSQLRKINIFLEERSEIEKYYDKFLLDLGFEGGLNLPKCNPKSVNWLYTRLVPESINRDELIAYLSIQGIETRPVFKPIMSFPYMKSFERDDQSMLNSEIISNRGISLPTFNGLVLADKAAIIKAIGEFMR